MKYTSVATYSPENIAATFIEMATAILQAKCAADWMEIMTQVHISNTAIKNILHQDLIQRAKYNYDIHEIITQSWQDLALSMNTAMKQGLTKRAENTGKSLLASYT